MTAALRENNRARFLAALAKNAEAVREGESALTSQSLEPGQNGSSVAPASAPSLMPSDPWMTDGYNWRALAQCETGSDWTMHGSVYSTAFGISTGASEQTTESLAGLASPEEQLRIAIAVERRAGIDSWGCAWAAKGG